jgi:hypothetical protein
VKMVIMYLCVKDRRLLWEHIEENIKEETL